MHFVLDQVSGRLSFERQHVECQKYEHGTQPGTIAFVIFTCKDKCLFCLKNCLVARKFRKIDIVFRSLTLRFNLGARKACASDDAAMEMGWLILLFDLIGNLPGGGSGGGVNWLFSEYVVRFFQFTPTPQNIPRSATDLPIGGKKRQRLK